MPTEDTHSNSEAENFNHENDSQHTEGSVRTLVLRSRKLSTYTSPYFEMINIGHEGFVTPVYEISFWRSLAHLDVWLVFYTTFVMWGIGMTMTGNWNIKTMLAARDPNTTYAKYILFASMSGISAATGRTFIGTYEEVLNRMYLRFGTPMVSTWAYPVASIGMFISMILWIALPGNYAMIIPYILGPYMFGMSHSMTFYILNTMFDRDIGMHYSFSFLAAAIGLFIFYYLVWFLPYNHYSTVYPFYGRICVGKRKCMNTTLAIYVALSFSSILTSFWFHFRYKKLLEGKRSKERETS
ncbi:unnamed protein product [Phytomonas sp. Hart1]|nr:unnamed protein product [Phytomonas sp. Hart1]|eukprot:CCW71977.1 unnamed protein product [Phytomonas sp. isolate Hart1]